MSWAWDDGLDMLSGFGFVAVFAVGIAVLVAIIIAASVAVESRNCAYASRQFGRPTHYDRLEPNHKGAVA